MPFVTQDHRDNPDFKIPGDRVYTYYKRMIDAWNEEPRWTTADRIYRTMVLPPYADVAINADASLAWQVFFALKVMPYEYKKMEENGDI